MKFNKWWGLLVGLIISIIVGFLIGGYVEGEHVMRNNLIGLGIIIAGFIIGWVWESQSKGKKEKTGKDDLS